MIENKTQFEVPVWDGQKTGWFYDHRLNRERINRHVKGKRVLDICSYAGGWGVQAANAGAQQVTCVDVSKQALNWVENNAQLNGVADNVTCIQGDAFTVMEKLIEEGQLFDVVILDPPAFIPKRKDHSHLDNHVNNIILLDPNGDFAGIFRPPFDISRLSLTYQSVTN